MGLGEKAKACSGVRGIRRGGWVRSVKRGVG